MKIKLPILFYHKVAEPEPNARSLNLYVSPTNFDRQMYYLYKRGYKTISLDTAIYQIKSGRSLPDKSVVITFDDGHLDNYEYAFPILKKYDFAATIFIVTDFVGKDAKWPHSNDPQPTRLMSWENIKEMAQYGISFGSHTCNHCKLNTLSVDELSRELVQSKKKLENELQQEITSFCYPYGEYNGQVVGLVEHSGYQGACSTLLGNRHTAEEIYTLKRVLIWHDTPLWKFGYYLTSLYDFEHTRKQNRKLKRGR